MEVGYRVLRPDDIGIHPLPLVQISLWRTADWGVADGEQAVVEAIAMAAECRRRAIRSVFHPLEYPLTGDRSAVSLGVLRRLAAVSDLGIILHDEGGSDGGRLSEGEAAEFERNLREASSWCPVSIENSFDSRDARWFWERFVVPENERVTITIDIGHLESAGIDSVAFTRDLPERLMRRVAFVHLHHSGRLRGGIRDQWPLVPGCREIEALRVLQSRKPGLWTVLELDAQEAGVMESVRLLLRESGGVR